MQGRAAAGPAPDSDRHGHDAPPQVPGFHVPVGDNVAKTVQVAAPPRKRFSRRRSRPMSPGCLAGVPCAGRYRRWAGSLRTLVVLHPPLGELRCLAVRVEADDPEVAVAARWVAVESPSLHDREFAVDRQELPGEVGVARLVLVPDPAVDDLLAAAPRPGV